MRDEAPFYKAPDEKNNHYVRWWIYTRDTQILTLMSWFHYTKLERLQRNRSMRRECAEQAYKDAGENIFTLPDLIKDAHRNARDEERMFEAWFHEPMPKHMREALDLEVSFWQQLDSMITKAKNERLTETDYETVKDHVRDFTMVLIDLLHAEEEMVTSCLQQHYLELLHDLEHRAEAIR